MDSNHRRLSRRIYSPLHLTALPPLLINNHKVERITPLKYQCVSTIIANNSILPCLSTSFLQNIDLFFQFFNIRSVSATASGDPTKNSLRSLSKNPKRPLSSALSNNTLSENFFSLIPANSLGCNNAIPT